MNKLDLISAIAKSTGYTRGDVHHTVSATLHIITQALSKGERVTLVGFGTFIQRQRKARTGVNPQNPKEKIIIEAAKVPTFRPGTELKDIVDGRAKQGGRRALSKGSKVKKATLKKRAKKQTN